MDDLELPRRPLVPGHIRWQRREMFGFEDPNSVPYQLYLGGKPTGLFATSEFYPGDSPAWHLALSAMWRRPREDEVLLMLQDFGAEALEEVPSLKSLVRHFVWPPCRDTAVE